jgi:hypothetical protein
MIGKSVLSGIEAELLLHHHHKVWLIAIRQND